MIIFFVIILLSKKYLLAYKQLTRGLKMFNVQKEINEVFKQKGMMTLSDSDDYDKKIIDFNQAIKSALISENEFIPLKSELEKLTVSSEEIAFKITNN